MLRVQHLEHRLRHLGEVLVDPLVHARGEEREPLEQPLDVLVLALSRLELEPLRHVLVRPR